MTVTVAEPLLPSLVAMIVAVPAAPPLTSPLPLTVATDVFELAQVTARPPSALPLASRGVAVSCTVWPTCREGDVGATLTAATGTLVTVIDAAPLLPSALAVMVAAPAATPLTRPLLLTVAKAVLLLAQLTGRPVSGLPAASWGTALSCIVAPDWTLAELGLTTTDATGTLTTVITAAPL